MQVDTILRYLNKLTRGSVGVGPQHLGEKVESEADLAAKLGVCSKVDYGRTQRILRRWVVEYVILM